MAASKQSVSLVCFAYIFFFSQSFCLPWYDGTARNHFFEGLSTSIFSHVFVFYVPSICTGYIQYKIEMESEFFGLKFIFSFTENRIARICSLCKWQKNRFYYISTCWNLTLSIHKSAVISLGRGIFQVTWFPFSYR